MSNRLATFFAVVLLVLMGISAFFSMQQDALTFDELAHIPAGYSYLTKQDYRINPEHPPLLKDIAALPLLFLNLNFPDNSENWQQSEQAPMWWVQFDLGTEFLYQSGNNPQDIIFFSRLPMIFLLLLLGGFLFWWSQKRWGNIVGLGVLTLFAFSPSFIAHGRLVTTDVAAALGAVVAFYFWLEFVKKPSPLNILKAGLALGVALSLKFSLLLLLPVLGIISLLYPLLKESPTKRIRTTLKYLGYALVAGLIGLVIIIWPLYQFHITDYPAERQVRDTTFDLTDTPKVLNPVKDLTIWSADKPILRPFAQYMRGVLMATQRTTYGNTVYFLGEITAGGWWYYFPVIYSLKIPLAFHILLLLSFLYAAWYAIRKHRAIHWIRHNIELFTFLLFLCIYWGAAMTGNLNIGIRHLLPTLPFIYILCVLGIKRLLSATRGKTPKLLLTAGVILLFTWYIVSSLLSFPTYISYYNEAGGGVVNGYKHAVDSNYDWGQDFYKLVAFANKNNIKTLNLDYFGGEHPPYYLGDRVRTFNPIEEQPRGWVAISLNQLQGGQAIPTPSFDQTSGYYNWLLSYEPVARIGTSIVVYWIE